MVKTSCCASPHRHYHDRLIRTKPGTSHERKQHTAGGARRTSGARHRAQGVRITRRSLDHRGGRLRLLRDRPRTRGVRHGNDRESGELVPGHERLGDRSDAQVIRASNSRHSGSGHHGHPGVRGGNRRRGARDRPPGEVSTDRKPGYLRPGAAHGIQELRGPPRHRIRGPTRTLSYARRSSRSRAWRMSRRLRRSKGST